jgi:uncharacterized protein YcbX
LTTVKIRQSALDQFYQIQWRALTHGAPKRWLRANVYVAGWPVWSELDLLGKVLAVGPFTRLKVVKRIVRCAATNVDPQSGIRDLNVPLTLLRTYGKAIVVSMPR